MEAISSASDIDLEDGEIIDDSDSDLSILCIKDTKQFNGKHSLVNSGSDILLFPVRSPSPKKRRNKSKENKKVDYDGTKLVIKITGHGDPSRGNGDHSRHKTHRHRRRKKADKIYEDWNRSIDLLTSPKKRKKPVTSSHRYSSCESLNSERHSSKKTCIEPKQCQVSVEGNPLLAKLLRAGDINPSSVILKEKNGKNEKTSVISHLSDVSSSELCMEQNVRSPLFHSTLSDVTDVSSDGFSTNQSAKKLSVLHAKLSDVSSDEMATQDLILKNCNHNNQNLSKSPSSGTSFEAVKISNPSEPPYDSSIVYIDELSKTSEVSVQTHTSEENETIIIPKKLSQSYLSYENTVGQNDVYSPETFTPFDYNTLQDTETLELRAALANKSDLVSENYDCIPMSCSEDDEVSSVDSKSEKSEDSKPQQQNNDTDSEEEEELRLRIGALKTWLQRKYGKSKPDINSVNEGNELRSSMEKLAASSTEKIASEQNDLLNTETPPTDNEQSLVENYIPPNVESDPSCSSSVVTSTFIKTSSMADRVLSPPPGNEIAKKLSEKTETVEFKDEAVLKPEDPPVKAVDNSLLDEEASENYELALRSLLVSKLLKQKLENSNDLLTESNLINKASSSLINKSPGKISSKASSVPNTSQPSKVTSNSKYRTVNSTKTSAQNPKNSANKSGLIHCDSFQSKYVFNNFYEPPNQVEDSKYLSSISNFKLPVVEKFVIHLSEDSDYDSDESERKIAREPSIEVRSAGSSESSLEKSAVKIPMVVPNSRSPSKSTQPCRMDQSYPTASYNDSVRVESPILSEAKNAQLTVKTAMSNKQDRVTNSSKLQVGKPNTCKTSPAKTTSKLVRTSSPNNPVVISSPTKVTSGSLPVSVNGSKIESTSILQESKNVSSLLRSQEKLKKANSVLIADVLVPVEKKLLKSRLNLLTNLDSMQGCVSSCEENASKCSKSFAKIVQLQKALKLATSEYKAQFKYLKGSLQSYKVQSQEVSSCLSEYAQAQKDCAKAGKQILGPNYKTPNEGMSAMAMKFKLMKEKKLELLNNVSIANEIKKANFSSDASGTTVAAALKSMSEGNVCTDGENSLDPTAIPTITVNGADSCDQSEKILNGPHSRGTAALEMASSEAEKATTVIDASCDTYGLQTSSTDSAAQAGSSHSEKSFHGKAESSMENTCADSYENKTGTTASKSDAEIGRDSSFQITSPPPLPESLIAMLKVTNGEQLESEGVFKCQQKFTKYTPVFTSLCRTSNRDGNDSVDSIICPFNLQGTCRDETCEYKHLPN